ncbi:hypothetical protein F2P79_004797 [Pimephales promelas]|nr:hypothetical protein F2P79_004797 [Pimephales promelas]
MSQRSNSRKGNGDNQSETVRSRSSCSSGTSSSSKISMVVAMAKAKSEAVQARAAHALKEIQLKVEQARVQADLDALNEEKEKDAAIAEANALVAGLQDMGFEVRNQHVAAYVSAQVSLCSEARSDGRGSDYVSPTVHSLHPQPVNVIPSTPHPRNASQTQDAASANIMPQQPVKIKDPATGLHMAWGRLDEIYGSPEAVEQALFNKLENFPKVTTKDPQRLRDLADLLSELLAAKEDGYVAGLSYLDSSRGIKPII